jgi:hypothetical protein
MWRCRAEAGSSTSGATDEARRGEAGNGRGVRREEGRRRKHIRLIQIWLRECGRERD